MKKILFFGMLLFAVNASAQQQQLNEPKQHRKFLHQTEIGMLLGRQSDIINNPGYPVRPAYSSYYIPYYSYAGRSSVVAVQHFSGYRAHKLLAVGLTAGLDYYNNNIITPLALGLRSQWLPNRRISPSTSLDAGYGFMWASKQDKANKYDINGGFMLQPGAGIRIKLADDGSGLLLNVGYKIQKSGYSYEVTDQQYYLEEQRNYRRLSIRLGFEF
jgi:hypothetical protein